MSHRALVGAALLALPLFLAPAVARADAAADEAAVRALEDRWFDALVRRDRTAVEPILADDFLQTNWQGRVKTRQEVLDGLAKPPDHPPGTQRLIDVRVRLHGDMAIVTGTDIVTTADGGQVVRVRFTDVFVRAGKGWRAVTAQETLAAPGVP